MFAHIHVRKVPAFVQHVVYNGTMNLEHNHCYAAIQSRDERFDGRFFTGVLTTGIFCRPVCPARTPLRENVRFFATAAGAAEAGFRPCLRCRPEHAPDLDPHGATALVARGSRLIANGALDEGGVDALAARLHISARQLRRHFVRELGVPPLAIAQTRRLLFAKKLIDETALPMTEIAFAAGYASVRRFNDALRQTYGRAPSDLRRQRAVETDVRPTDQAHIELKLFYRPPYQWPLLLRFLGAHLLPGVEAIDERGYRRTLRMGDAAGIVAVRPVPDARHLLLRVPLSLTKHARAISESAKRLFDLNAEPDAVGEHLRADEALRPLIDRWPGLRVPGAWDPFEVAVRTILGQQVSLQAATTLAGRLIRAFGEPLDDSLCDGELTHLFPTPQRLADADIAQIGMPSRRAAAINTLASAVASGALSLGTGAALDETLARLTALPGIGSWTANYIALRALGEPDAFPAGDLILRRALADSPRAALTERQLLARAETWRPWRGYAAMALWTDYGERKEGTQSCTEIPQRSTEKS